MTQIDTTGAIHKAIEALVVNQGFIDVIKTFLDGDEELIKMAENQNEKAKEAALAQQAVLDKREKILHYDFYIAHGYGQSEILKEYQKITQKGNDDG